MLRVYSLEERCLNCRLCEVACKTAHSLTGDTVKAYLWEQPSVQPRIHVEGDNFASIVVNCRHCERPACVEGCISGALSKNAATGVVSCDTDKCVGCRTCMALCPYGAIRVERVAYKCDMCTTGHSVGLPACVKACINQALVLFDSSDGCSCVSEEATA